MTLIKDIFKEIFRNIMKVKFSAFSLIISLLMLLENFGPFYILKSEDSFNSEFFKDKWFYFKLESQTNVIFIKHGSYHNDIKTKLQRFFQKSKSITVREVFYSKWNEDWGIWVHDTLNFFFSSNS